MAPQDKAEQDAKVIAAAEAAASWARARRATWTSVPLAAQKPVRDAPKPSRQPLPPIEFETVEFDTVEFETLEREPPPPTKPAPAPPRQPPPSAAVEPRTRDADRSPRTPAPITLAAKAPTPPAPIAAPPRTPPPPPPQPITLAPSQPISLAQSPPIALATSFDTRDTDRAPRAAPPPFVASTRDEAADTGSRTPGTTWLARIAVAAAVVGGGAFAWSYFSGPSTPASTRASSAAGTGPAAAAAKDAPPKPDARKGTGALKIESTPAGAQVTVDGKPRGVTPLTLSDLPAGKHDVILKSDAGTVHRTVTVAASQTQSLDEQIFAGWVTVYSPFEVTIAEGSRVLRPDDRNQFMLPPGMHQLRLMNKSLAYDSAVQVDVKPGEGTNVRLTPAPSSLTVNAPDASEVTIDGARAGETPLSNVSIPLGTHDIVVRRANGAEKRYTITVGTKAYTLNVDF